MSGKRRPTAGPETLFELFDLGSPDDTEWMLSALCAETDPEVFHPAKGEPTLPAKRVCERCPVRVECLADALAKNLRDGVRGGLSARERRPFHNQARAVAAERLVA